MEKGLLIQDFLDRTATQLSYDGLLALHEVVKERQLAVFFRNSHFSALMKYNGDLYLLCTDIAFAHSPVVWERLDEVDGNTTHCDAQFQVNHGTSDEATAAMVAAQFAQAQTGGGLPDDPDALLAMQLMQEDLQADLQAQAAGAGAGAAGRPPAAPAAQPLPLARQAAPEGGAASTDRTPLRAGGKKKICCAVQ